MEQIPLAVENRTQTRKGGARKLRAAGLVPAVVYSGGGAADNLQVEARELERVLRQGSGESAFLSLQFADGASRMAVIKELQYDYLGIKVQHADFYEVRADQDITLDIPIELVGDAVGVKEGGYINQAAYSLSLTGRVADLPDSVQVDISELAMNESMHSTDLVLPEKVTLASDEAFVVVSCSEPTVEAEPEEEELEEGEEAEGEESAEEKAEE